MRRLRLVVIGVLLTLSCWRCQSTGDHQTKEGAENASIPFPDTSSLKDLSGEQVAYAYCQPCHLFPEPALLSKGIWKNGVLPRMGQRLGISNGTNPYNGLSYDEIQLISLANIFPSNKKITEEAWQKLVDFYVTNAPDNMAPQTAHEEASKALPFFTVEEIVLEKGFLPLTTLVHFDSASASLWIGNAKNRLEVLDQNYQVIQSLVTESPPVSIARKGDITYLLEVGILNPTDNPKGVLVRLDHLEKKQTLLHDLPRPVHLSTADLNQDNQPDFVISNFGYRLGNLSWYEVDDTGKGQFHVLSEDPGACKTAVYDFNQDGLPDIMALMAQGDERIMIFYNEGAGKFKPKTVLRFPPVYGSSYFDLADFNQDGKVDILYANGDNADFSFALKSYHGIRIYENQGNDHFKEKFFYPLYGATMAKARDFDQDGDLDIAAVAYFTDLGHTPEKGFVYFENNSKEAYNFKSYTFPEAKRGRWLTFDIGDVDQDGDEDIMLGSFAYNSMPVPKDLKQEWMNNGPDVLILKNTLH